MLDFVIFAVTFVTVLIAVVFYLYPGTRRSGTTIPGMDPSDPKDGNLVDIQRAGSLHEFLMALHTEHGPIASFWLETQLVVSLASPLLFADHRHVFDRAGDLFGAFRPLLGNKSVFFANGTDGRKQHHTLVEMFSNTSSLLEAFDHASAEMARKLESLPVDQHVALTQYMMALAAKSILVALFGDAFLETKNILDFRRNYEICMLDVEQKLQGITVDEVAAKTKVETAIKALRNQMRATLAARRSLKVTEQLVIDKLLTMDYSEDTMIDNALTYFHSGFQSTGYLLTWVLYYLATNPEVQERVYAEVSAVGGHGDVPVIESQIKGMRYTRQVIDETLRLSNVVPFATRSQDLDVEVGGHIVPKRTPVVHALGVVHRDETVWISAEKFDPDRFSEDSRGDKQSRSTAFFPFGFGGKRQCPASDLVRMATTVVLVNVLSTLTVRLIDDGQVVEPNYCVYAKPHDEIWATFAKRTTAE